MKLGRPIRTRRLAVLGLASAIALGTSAIPASAATPSPVPDTARTPAPTPFVPVPYPNLTGLTITKSYDKGSTSLLSHGGQDDYIVVTMENVLITN
jgi:hypothetical protein